ncbi:TPA: helix-turn-helix domain-containing protein [Staphylococcus pseudintermedius]|nr:helix-turn-helix domain-containing protein [Staphylococcus pseudintermedius]
MFRDPLGTLPLEITVISRDISSYRGYITKRSLRLMKDEYGNQSMVVDEVLRGRMETRLITKILSFEIK